jgi:hypothetical protein
MTYTLWSHGRLLGESPLDFARCMSKLRVGFLHPTAAGEKLLPVACGASPAGVAWGRAIRAANVQGEACHRLPEYADFQAACDEEAALALELRGPDGNVIPTEDIAVRDTEWVLATFPVDEEEFTEPLTPEEQAEIDELLDEFEARAAEQAADDCWRPPREERPWMRYQLQVRLVHDWVMP